MGARWEKSADEALAQVHGGNSIRSVSRETKIPRTLQRALDGGMNNDVKSFSRRLLTSEEEVMIVDWACPRVFQSSSSFNIACASASVMHWAALLLWMLTLRVASLGSLD